MHESLQLVVASVRGTCIWQTKAGSQVLSLVGREVASSRGLRDGEKLGEQMWKGALEPRDLAF